MHNSKGSRAHGFPACFGALTNGANVTLSGKQRFCYRFLSVSFLLMKNLNTEGRSYSSFHSFYNMNPWPYWENWLIAVFRTKGGPVRKQKEIHIIAHRRLFEKLHDCLLKRSKPMKLGWPRSKGMWLSKMSWVEIWRRQIFWEKLSISIVSEAFIVYQLPITVFLDSVRFEWDQNSSL